MQRIAQETIMKELNSRNFKLGDYVYLLKGPKPKKFGDHYTGPLKILEIPYIN